MIPLLAALSSGLAFTALQVLFKRHTSPKLTPLALPALLGLMAPLWATLLATTHSHHLLTYTLTPQALLYPALWAFTTVATTTTLVWLLARLSLTEVAGYRKALITLGALTSDVLVFATNFPALKLAAIALLLTGAIMLGKTRHRLPTRAEALVLIAWCSALTLQITCYKKGVLAQPEVLSHTILAQLFAATLYALLWLLPSVRKAPLPGLPLILAMLACAFMGDALEGFAYKNLPLAAVMLLTILPATLFAAHDLWRRDLPLTRKSLAALAALLTGFTLLMLKF